MTELRKQQIRELRADGARVYYEGRSIFSTPHDLGVLDQAHWSTGWADAESEDRRQAQEREKALEEEDEQQNAKMAELSVVAKEQNQRAKSLQDELLECMGRCNGKDDKIEALESEFRAVAAQSERFRQGLIAQQERNNAKNREIDRLEIEVESERAQKECFQQKSARLEAVAKAAEGLAKCASILGNIAPRDFRSALQAYRKAVEGLNER